MVQKTGKTLGEEAGSESEKSPRVRAACSACCAGGQTGAAGCTDGSTEVPTFATLPLPKTKKREAGRCLCL